jgi:pimeloyl-ACP methyl ester carboxylesterase
MERFVRFDVVGLRHGVGFCKRFGKSHRPCVVLVHGNGLSKEIFVGVVRRLPTDWGVLAVDMPGHGSSDAIDVPSSVEVMDVLAQRVRLLLRDELTSRGRAVWGVGHSSGAALLLLIAQQWRFDRLLLHEPIVLKRPEGVTSNPIAERALKRRREFPDRQSIQKLLARPPYNAWAPECLEAYAVGAFRNGTLACAPELEARIFSQPSTRLWSDAYVPIDTPGEVLVGKDTTFLSADYVVDMRQRMAVIAPKLRVLEVEGDHFLPIVNPDLFVSHLLPSDAKL